MIHTKIAQLQNWRVGLMLDWYVKYCELPQYSRSGFTSLLACLPALLKPTTTQGVREAFERVSAKDVNAWVQKHFSSTLTSRHNATHAEHKATLKIATVQHAIT